MRSFRYIPVHRNLLYVLAAGTILSILLSFRATLLSSVGIQSLPSFPIFNGISEKSDPSLPPFCPYCGPSDSLCQKYGEDNLARSRAYEGANARLRRILRKAHFGSPIKIGVLGGSVSAGQGVYNRAERWHEIYAQWWRDTFYNSTSASSDFEMLDDSEDTEARNEAIRRMVQLVDGAIPATHSDYLQSCFQEHIDEDVDVVVVELAINDMRTEKAAISYEFLLRGLLVLPNAPAVINAQVIGLHNWLVTTGGDLDLAIAMYYDLPVVNIRNILLPHILQNKELEHNLTRYYFNHNKVTDAVDLGHLNANGHRVMAEILISFTQRIYCDELRRMNDATGAVWQPLDETLPGSEALEYIPRLRMFMKYDNETVIEPMRPMCMSLKSTKHPLKPAKANGWEFWTAPESKLKKDYYRATVPGSTISFEIQVGPLGRVRVSHLRSKTFGMGSALCWVQVDGVPDAEKKYGRKIEGYWDREGLNLVDSPIIAEQVPPGTHLLTCRLLKESADPNNGTDFRIVAIDAA
ncbi:hypothetical protein SISSUDRAFT_1129916 [Sistotremastrum suecicum HHB10207 ss-3]|uniref:Capsular associated protein n=1 Tax=Sistotremastrum suecicum HHB10207 ss-3 TaxID=1314776 RepID=A0A166C4Q8_9AGAM|nr:hypothetical protein SISSUDRAFT_1129916 [Sistotremastrum suecicum HHB10207 ss-3]